MPRLAVLLQCVLLVGTAAAAEVDFARDIRPILSENCVFCHGPDQATREAGLRLDTESGAAEVLEPGASDASELLLRILHEDPDQRMPPPDSNRSLTAAQVELIRAWIDQGAQWETHWSFRPLTAPPIPTAGDPRQVRNPIDAFVQRKLADHDLQPAPEADRRTLIRRVSLDLTGLPPTPQQVDAFVADPDPDAYERLVDRLLDSPDYGVRMAWDWLDAARYADTNGYQGDNERTMWPWRDWVVQAFNENMPYDQFTIWQLAGDLLPSDPSTGATDQQKLATGFLRNHMINGEGGRIAEENRVEYVMDMSETMGTVWLGLTLNCCRCHDHKYDPLTNENYYQLFAFFNQTPVTGGGGDPQTPPVLAVPNETQQQQLAALDQQLHSIDKEADPERHQQLVKQRESLQAAVPKVMVMQDMSGERESFVLERGLYNKPAAAVSAGLPEFLPAPSAPSDAGSMNRLDLARWLTDPAHPLTARVTVNRFWQQLFGIGLVKTSEDFGAQGEIPVQMELLNWLAATFRDDGWNVKKLLRLIVTSHTYRQSARITSPSQYENDPDNRLLARGARYRIPSWMIRDQALAASGLLSPLVGGPSVNTYQPPGVWEEASFGKKKYQRDEGEKLYRRSLYTFWRRIAAPTMFFDSAPRQTCSVTVNRTNTPLHALQTLNNTAYVEAARVLAEQTLTRPGLSRDAERIDHVMQQVLARSAGEAETRVLQAGLHRSAAQFAADPDAATRLLAVGELPAESTLDPVEHAAWTSLCLAVLNLDETLNRE